MLAIVMYNIVADRVEVLGYNIPDTGHSMSRITFVFIYERLLMIIYKLSSTNTEY